MDHLTLFRMLTKTIDYWFNQGAPEKALMLIREYEQQYPDEPHFAFNKHGFLIDIGLALKDEAVIREGIAGGETLLLCPEHHVNNARILYHLANGYDALYKVKDYGTFKAIVTSENLQKIKDLLRQALSSVPDDAVDLKVRILTNLGNCYDQLGRGAEAIQIYEQALIINPKHEPISECYLGRS
jgi:tetratricopeptide (TPR) repeat protein